MDLNLNPDWVKLHKAIDEAPEQTPCQNYPDAFFAEKWEDSSTTTWAKNMCAICPVIAECRDYGIKYEEFGIWGGTVPRQRKRLRAIIKNKGLIG